MINHDRRFRLIHTDESDSDTVMVSAQIAQLVEQGTENPRVTGSIPVLGICGCSSMVEH